MSKCKKTKGFGGYLTTKPLNARKNLVISMPEEELTIQHRFTNETVRVVRNHPYNTIQPCLNCDINGECHLWVFINTNEPVRYCNNKISCAVRKV
ncbi:MAG: hypothetical protein ACRDD8_06205 [Bacteroidales bacterium]